jgi:hypothetical protein
LLTFSGALASAQQFGTAEQATAMLDRAAAALKSDEAKALRDFNDTNNKLFHESALGLCRSCRPASAALKSFYGTMGPCALTTSLSTKQ